MSLPNDAGLSMMPTYMTSAKRCRTTPSASSDSDADNTTKSSQPSRADASAHGSISDADESQTPSSDKSVASLTALVRSLTLDDKASADDTEPDECNPEIGDDSVASLTSLVRNLALDDAVHADKTNKARDAPPASHDFHRRYPHLMDLVFQYADYSALVVLRATCRSYQRRSDVQLMQHVVVRQHIHADVEPWAGLVDVEPWASHLLPRHGPLVSTSLWTPSGPIPMSNPTRKAYRDAIRVLDISNGVRSARHMFFRLRFSNNVRTMRLGTFVVKARRLPRCQVLVVNYEPGDVLACTMWRRARDRVVVPVYNEMYPSFLVPRAGRVALPLLVVCVVNLASLTWKQASHPWFDLCMVFHRIANFLLDTTRNTPVHLVGVHELVRARYATATLDDAQDVVFEKLHEVLQMHIFNVAAHADRVLDLDRISFLTVDEYRAKVGEEQYLLEMEYALERQELLDIKLDGYFEPVALETVLELGHTLAGRTFV